MCGISGILSLNGSPVEKAIIQTMSEKLRHRGPDNAGLYFSEDGMVGLAHRRLAVIDLSPEGHQPMSFQKRYWITYNGEIYNYKEIREFLSSKGFKFQSDSDTEVLLAAYQFWGEDCLQEFDGMFAFAIWDEEAKTLFCARDRFGEKPFYYSY
ncbi:MAG: asparagine synthetase B, partial [Chitinophagales bacterium]|nr:asparagine synthetase B [Chitinophagales bacterium]